MAEETDAHFERLEKESQESRAQMTKMMELIRTLIRDKGQTSGPSPQNETAQPDQRREELVYPAGFTPPYAPNVHMAQATSRRVSVWLCSSLDMGKRSGAKLRAKYG